MKAYFHFFNFHMLLILLFLIGVAAGIEKGLELYQRRLHKPGRRIRIDDLDAGVDPQHPVIVRRVL